MRSSIQGGAAYALTTSAMQGMVRGLARDFGARGITVNSIQPGPTDSDMNPAGGPMAETMHSFMAIKRHATASEVAELTAYLAGPHDKMITGSRWPRVERQATYPEAISSRQWRLHADTRAGLIPASRRSIVRCRDAPISSA